MGCIVELGVFLSQQIVDIDPRVVVVTIDTHV